MPPLSVLARRNLTLGSSTHRTDVQRRVPALIRCRSGPTDYPFFRPTRKDQRMPDIGPAELLIILAIVLIVFGPKRLPGLGRSLGSGLREFKDSIDRRHDEDDDEDLSKAIKARND